MKHNQHKHTQKFRTKWIFYRARAKLIKRKIHVLVAKRHHWRVRVITKRIVSQTRTLKRLFRKLHFAKYHHVKVTIRRRIVVIRRKVQKLRRIRYVYIKKRYVFRTRKLKLKFRLLVKRVFKLKRAYRLVKHSKNFKSQQLKRKIHRIVKKMVKIQRKIIKASVSFRRASRVRLFRVKKLLRKLRKQLTVVVHGGNKWRRIQRKIVTLRVRIHKLRVTVKKVNRRVILRKFAVRVAVRKFRKHFPRLVVKKVVIPKHLNVFVRPRFAHATMTGVGYSARYNAYHRIVRVKFVKRLRLRFVKARRCFIRIRRAYRIAKKYFPGTPKFRNLKKSFVVSRKHLRRVRFAYTRVLVKLLKQKVRKTKVALRKAVKRVFRLKVLVRRHKGTFRVHHFRVLLRKTQRRVVVLRRKVHVFRVKAKMVVVKRLVRRLNVVKRRVLVLRKLLRITTPGTHRAYVITQKWRKAIRTVTFLRRRVFAHRRAVFIVKTVYLKKAIKIARRKALVLRKKWIRVTKHFPGSMKAVKVTIRYHKIQKRLLKLKTKLNKINVFRTKRAVIRVRLAFRKATVKVTIIKQKLVIARHTAQSHRVVVLTRKLKVAQKKVAVLRRKLNKVITKALKVRVVALRRRMVKATIHFHKVQLCYQNAVAANPTATCNVTLRKIVRVARRRFHAIRRQYRIVKIIHITKKAVVLKRKIQRVALKIVVLRRRLVIVSRVAPGSKKSVVLRKRIHRMTVQLRKARKTLHKIVTVRLVIITRKLKTAARKQAAKVHKTYIRYITFKRVHPNKPKTKVLYRKYLVAKKRLSKIKQLVKLVVLRKSFRNAKRAHVLVKRAAKIAVSYRRRYLRAVTNNRHHAAQKLRRLWIKSHKKAMTMKKAFRKVLIKHLSHRIVRLQIILVRRVKRQRVLRKKLFKALNNFAAPHKIRRLRKALKVATKRVYFVRKLVFRNKLKRVTVRLNFFRRVLRIRTQKMLRIRRALVKAKKHGHFTIALKLKVKFTKIQNKVRVLARKVHVITQRRMTIRVHRYRKLAQRNTRRARKLHRMLVVAKARQGMSFCATVIQGQYHTAMRLANKYRKIFHSIRAKLTYY